MTLGIVIPCNIRSTSKFWVPQKKDTTIFIEWPHTKILSNDPLPRLNRNIDLKLHKAPLLHICGSYNELRGVDLPLKNGHLLSSTST